MGRKRSVIRRMIRNGYQNDPKYLASCHGKQKHQTYELAKVAADTKPSIVKPYKCNYGNHYHIGRRHG